jgi:hypothetical protein
VRGRGTGRFRRLRHRAFGPLDFAELISTQP